MISVTLSKSDMDWVREVGRLRMATAKGAPKWAYKDGRSGVDTHTIGCAGELAFCRVVGVPWPATNNVGRREPDVPPRWEVRWAGRPVLKVARNDPPERLVALVTGKIPNMVVIGYCIAGWAQRTKRLEDLGKRGEPAHFVPERELVPIEPGFHHLCGWERAAVGLWQCPFCGKTMEAA